jgi:hypothetical protein
MIELSKCPNCAVEDRVTIAGKEFCMRCGTPAEDNAMMGVSDPASNVTKFNSPQASNEQAPQPQAQQAQVHDVATQPQAPAAGMDMSNSGSQNPTGLEEKSALDSQINNLSAQQPVPQQPAPQQTPQTVMNQAPQEQPVQTKPFTPPPAPVMKKMEPATEAVQPAKIAVATDMPSAHSAMNQQKTNAMPVQGSISLDKSAGVLSDDQFDQLRNSVDAPNVLSGNPVDNLSPAATEPTVAAQPQVQAPAPAAMKNQNDIYSSPSPAAASSANIPTPEVNENTAPPAKPKPDKKKKVLKPAGIAVSIIALFMVGAYVWKLNYSNLAFKVASSKAGMSASMPGYVPAGFNLSGDIRTNPGTVSYNLVNSSANKNISVTQTKTDWDSQALAENYVAPKSENYLALQAQGLTIYVLGSNQATWINKGTWYKLESSDKALTQDQIIKIATSL